MSLPLPRLSYSNFTSRFSTSKALPETPGRNRYYKKGNNTPVYEVTTYKTCGYIYSLLEKVSAEIVCLIWQTIMVQLSGIGILQIAPGCCLKTSEVTLPSFSSSSQTSVGIYEPSLHLNLSELSPALPQGQKLRSMPRTFGQLVKDVADKEDDYRETERTLDLLKNQLNEISFQRRTRTSQMILPHGSYLSIKFLSMGVWPTSAVQKHWQE